MMTDSAPPGLKIKHFVPKSQAKAPEEYASQKRVRPRVPDDQRKRARQACETCRQRKEKCYGGIPCHRCVRDNTVCTLVADRDETLDQSPLDRSLSKAERTLYLERVLKGILGISSLPDSELFVMNEALSKTDATERILDRREQVDGDDATGTSLLTFSRQLQQKLGGSRNQEEDLTMLEHRHSPSSGTETHLISLILTALPAKGIAEALIEICFSYGPVNSFYVSEQWIQRALNTSYGSPSVLTDEDLPAITTLAMVLAHGTQFVAVAPPTPILAMECVGSSVEELGKHLFERASGLLCELIKRPTFESARACLLIATFLFPIDLPRMAYTYLGLALHMAMRIGMHKRTFYANLGNSYPMREEQVRVWWTLYTFYQRSRVYHGHPRTLAHSDVDVDRPRPTTELEPLNGISNFRNQVALIEVTLILEDVADEISLLRKARKGVHVANLLGSRRKLVGLLEELPPLASLQQLEASTRRLRLDVHVHLHYWHSRLYLGRPFLLSQTTSGSTNEETSHKITSGRKLLAQDSVDAAIRIVQLCQIIHDRIGLTRTSYATEFTCCRAAMLVLIAKSITRKGEDTDGALEQGLDLIQQMSVGQNQASSDTRVIKALQRAIARLHSDKITEAQVHQENSYGEMSYDDFFQHWERLWQQGSSSPYDPSTLNTASSLTAPMSVEGALNVDTSADSFPDFSGFGTGYDTSDWWNEFTIIPELDDI